MEFSCFCRLVVLVHLFILCVSVTHLHSLATDEAALLALKAHINPETQNILANNWTAATSVCNWIGVTCGGQPRRVTALNLPSMGLNGTLPPHIGNLSALSLFSINNNSFYGSLPNELSHLRSLKTIDFGINFFTGEIPVELGNLTMLNDLYLSYNNLEGTIPWEIGFLTNLKNLSISHNHLTGHIPSSIGNCSLLKEINFSGNNLTGLGKNCTMGVEDGPGTGGFGNFLTLSKSEYAMSFHGGGGGLVLWM
ncbi:hypothetical protein COLO4_37324 [Corchorus olitorius]|uniref:Leucine-rich repeat-containing N-terminal plant-type domain-containing protein n=1 Tax=Corchorus olitorius TaxID=93759 RepID=A0A1R3G2F2_9ROSI|nr:hypothetical protein COLO4_37324 [Corchorus olitorius]